MENYIGCRRRRSYRYGETICLVGLGISTKGVSHDIWFHGRNFDIEAPEYQCRTLPPRKAAQSSGCCVLSVIRSNRSGVI
jgi:hypothetical protein